MATKVAENERLRWFGLWRAMAWFMLIAVIVVTLMPPPDGIPPVFKFQDKAAHAFAYMVLMCGFGCLTFGQRLLKPAVMLVTVGVGLECAQFFTATRMFELWDMAANTSGVFLGLLLMKTSLRHCYLFIERLFGQR